MSTRYLDKLFAPRHIVVVGASERPASLGGMMLRNMLAGHADIRLSVVNEKGYDSVLGVTCYRKISVLCAAEQKNGIQPDLALVCVPPEKVPGVIRQLGQSDIPIAIIATGGLSRTNSHSGRPLMYSVKELGLEYGVRILGPETIGVMVPALRLNATYMHMSVKPGHVGFIGQSGTVASAVIDWSVSRDIGFSYLTTLGDGVDIDVDDLIDFMAQDRNTRVMLLHVERIRETRRFISAVRAASRSKPVIVLKTGINAELQWNPTPLAPGMYDSDALYNAVFERAGVLRVLSTDEMFDALETLSRIPRLYSEDIAIVCNGIGPSMLASDALTRAGGKLARLSETTITKLDQLLQPFWGRRNPIDLDYSAGAQEYAAVVDALDADPAITTVLVMFAPNLTEDSLQVADSVIAASERSLLRVFTCWLGAATVGEARDEFVQRGVASFATPEKAITAFMHMVNHRRNQIMLRQTPDSYQDPALDRHRIRKRLQGLMKSTPRSAGENAYLLLPESVRELLKDYGLHVAETYFCSTEQCVKALVKQLEASVHVSLLHRFNLTPFHNEAAYTPRQRLTTARLETVKRVSSETEAEEACRLLRKRCSELYHSDDFVGFGLQLSEEVKSGISFSMGITRDPTVGPLIFCGASGARTNALVDRQFALPPLNMALARNLVTKTYAYKIVQEVSRDPEETLLQLCEALVLLAQIAADIPELHSLEINPVRLDQSSLLVISARAQLAEPVQLSIQPYPRELVEWIMLPVSRRRVEIRPVRSEDEESHQQFLSELGDDSVRMRFFQLRRNFSHDEMAGMVQIDYDREMAFIAVHEGRTLGEVRIFVDADQLRCEFAVVVLDELRGERLGWVLMRKVIEFATEQGIIEMFGLVLPNNRAMLALAAKLSFAIRYDEEEDVMVVTKQLNEPEPWQAERMLLRRAY
ncbi:MAG: GNAT family N-acetyltransferase [unclassified Hahellaceae]|nr:GNAT family N-acetyltransferase [Hahellaceae bacterium]|tara:strand:- start:90343 stop:93126 length:2784 start_codon:yes stop_codon:yes gene_type:complete